jgi:hypothetical protein
MKKDYQLAAPNTLTRQHIVELLDTLLTSIEAALFTSADYATTVQPYTDRFCLSPQKRYARGYCTLTIQAMLQKFSASLNQQSHTDDAQHDALLNRFRIAYQTSWKNRDISHAHQMQDRIAKLTVILNSWPGFIKQGSVVGGCLEYLQHAMSWSINQTALNLIRPAMMKTFATLITWHSVLQSVQRIRLRLQKDQLSDHQIQQMHHHLINFVEHSNNFSMSHPGVLSSPSVRVLLNRIDMNLWLDRLQWMCSRLEQYVRQQGVLQQAIEWVAQHNRLVNIHRMISELNLIIIRLREWHELPDTVKQSISHLENVIFSDLDSMTKDMKITSQMVTALNDATLDLDRTKGK